MSRVFHRHLKASYPTAVAGDGPYLIDAAGKRYLDACGGAAVSCLGHSDPEVQAAISEQVKCMAYAHSSGCVVLKDGTWLQPEQWQVWVEHLKNEEREAC